VPDDIGSDLHPDVAAALGVLGSRPVEVEAITALPSPANERGNYRVRLDNGTFVKASLLVTASRAREIASILGLLRHRHLTRPLAQHRRGLVTEWVDGRWPDEQPAGLAEECGAILGSLHAVRVPRGFPFLVSRLGDTWDLKLRGDLATIVDAGLLDGMAAREALAAARQSAPPGADTGFVHRDFCPSNLVIDGDGLVRAIDNDSMACDALDYDLARWWYRWPMPDADRTAFLGGYARYRSPSSFERHFTFWMVLALVESAMFRIRGGTAQQDVPAAALAALLDDRARGQQPVGSDRQLPGRRVLFVSDLHLGARGDLASIDRERVFVRWLDRVGPGASDLFVLGDLFDFWVEYRSVVPRGFTRVLGRLATLADQGVRLHLFAGNHDRWLGTYLESELGARVYRTGQLLNLHGRMVYLAHGVAERGAPFGQRLIGSALARRVFGLIHPDVGISLARAIFRRSRRLKAAAAAHRSRLPASGPGRPPAAKKSDAVLDAELKAHARSIRQAHPGVEFIVLGHRHLPARIEFDSGAWCVDLGDWVSHRTYATFDGHQLELHRFDEIP
jgi:UDP-2,3-diacylglucosamine hydrolase